MGCDIHLKLERRRKGSAEWHSVRMTRYQCWGDRIYGMFARLANVRNNPEWGVVPLPMRGWPEDAAYDTFRAYCCEVVSDEDYEENEEMYDRWDDDYINETKANEWVEDGLSVEMSHDFYKGRRFISDPDAHSVNWCTTEEMRRCVDECFFEEGKPKPYADFVEWCSLLGAMEGIERGGYYECRAIYWFDN